MLLLISNLISVLSPANWANTPVGNKKASMNMFTGKISRLKLLRTALLCFIEEEGYFPLNIGAGKIQ